MKETRADIAERLFREGANCSQAIIGAFSDLIDIDREVLMKMVSPLGGGLSRLREVCGAVLGAAVVFGYFEGIGEVHTTEEKAELYRKFSSVADEFAKENGSYVCGELLGVRREGHVPEKRSDGYYEKRPCIKCVRNAAEILEKALENKNENPV